MIKQAIGLLAFMIAANTAQAQEVDCAVAEAQQDINLCAAKDWETADIALNAAYAKALAFLQDIDDSLSEDEKGAVKNMQVAQRSWIEFRDYACIAEGYAMHGGSAQSMVVLGCLSRLTNTRTADLEALAQSY